MAFAPSSFEIFLIGADAVLTDRPGLAEYAISHLGFVRFDSLMIDGQPHSGASVFWWVYVVSDNSTASAPMTLTLGEWYSDPTVVDQFQSLGLPVDRGEIDIRRGAQDEWRVMMRLKDDSTNRPNAVNDPPSPNRTRFPPLLS